MAGASYFKVTAEHVQPTLLYTSGATPSTLSRSDASRGGLTVDPLPDSSAALAFEKIKRCEPSSVLETRVGLDNGNGPADPTCLLNLISKNLWSAGCNIPRALSGGNIGNTDAPA